MGRERGGYGERVTSRTKPSLGHRIVTDVLPRLRGPRPDGPTTEAEIRAELDARRAGEPAGVVRPLPTRWLPGIERRFDVTADDRAGFRTWTITPRGRRVDRTVIHLHGGAYVNGIDPFHVLWCARLARALGARVVLPDYPLAPEHSWRDSWPQVVEAARWWAEHAERNGERPLVLSGDSAGGGYALSVALGVRDAGGPQPSHLVLHAPWVDLTTSTRAETVEAAEDDPWLDVRKMDVYARWWAGSTDDLARPEISPALADLSGLPPALMFFGTRDMLFPGGRLLARRAAEAGWDLTSVVESDLLHIYSIFPHFVTESRQAFARTVAFLQG